MKLPIQVPPVARAWASGTFGGGSRRTGGLLPAGPAAEVTCGPTTDCAAWACQDGQTCGECQCTRLGCNGTCNG